MAKHFLTNSQQALIKGTASSMIKLMSPFVDDDDIAMNKIPGENGDLYFLEFFSDDYESINEGLDLLQTAFLDQENILVGIAELGGKDCAVFMDKATVQKHSDLLVD